MILTDSEVGSLKAALNCWEWFGNTSTAIVFVGCVGEFVAEFTPLPKTKETGNELARLSLIVLILGIAGELLSAVRTSQLSGQIIANIEERAGKAKQKAGEADERASANNKEAEQLRKDAEGERLARVKIEEGVAWRRLNDDQRKEFASSLRRFSGQLADCGYLMSDMEAFSFSSDIAIALRAAGWRAVPPSASMITMKEISPPTTASPMEKLDTGAELASTADANSVAASQALAQELRQLGFDAQYKSSTQSTTTPWVWITVTHRPLGPQGEAKLRHEAEAKKQNK
ncbi:MAG TPA: hypothetical protein VN948_07360 [Terriglobales bacterium]|nr:hypothetical protein [Terriglobales bacterium]